MSHSSPACVSNKSVLETAKEPKLSRQLLRQQLIQYGRLVRAPEGDPLKSLTFIGGTTSLKTDLYVRKVGRPRHEWSAMLQKEYVKMSSAAQRAIHVEYDWRRAVYEYCMQ